MSAVMSPMFQSPGELPPEAPRGVSRSGAIAVAAGVLLFGLAIWGVRHLIADSKPPARQVARISVLPDAAPPPPPPKVEKREEPKPESKPQPQAEQAPRPVAPPAPEPLKMEGAAGNGPSAFAAGTVTKDYAGGPVVAGTVGGGTAVDRAAERLYANSVRQLLRDELERQLAPEAGDVSAQLALWVAADGRITRWEWSDAGEHEPELQGAMQRVAASMRLPAPAVASLALRFRLSLRSAT
jgi:outer membrane biosynthesis protein TonB